MKYKTERKIQDYLGKQIYYLTPISESDELSKDSSKQWNFRCVCGETVIAPPYRVISGHIKSCGCMRYKNVVHKEHNRSNLQKVDAESYIGQKMNMLTVVGYERPKEKGRIKLKCVCDCGETVYVFPYQFKKGTVQSCGCLRKAIKDEYGYSKNRLYGEWTQMIRRCYNGNSSFYPLYGGRGITVCKEWKESPNSFYDWVESIGGRPKGCTLDRIDNDGPYAPWNCRFVTQKEQNRNKRTNINITYNGKTQCLTDWANELGMNDETLRNRLFRSKWSVEKAFTTPVGSVKRNQYSD